MKTPKNIVMFTRKSEKAPINEFDSEIIDDSALIDCMNQLNSLRDSESMPVPRTERDILSKINQVSAEMSWFSQWLSVKTQQRETAA